MEKFTSDETLGKVFKALLKKIKQEAAMGRYPVFPPESIVIMPNGEIVAELKNYVESMRECLRKLGVTLYHLATGESEFNKPASYSIDGYTKSVDSKYWPVISLMLSGQAFDFPAIDKTFDRRKEYLEKFKNALGSIRNFTQKNTPGIAAKPKAIFTKIWASIDNRLPTINKIAMPILMSLCIWSAVNFFSYNITYSLVAFIIFFGIAFAIALLITAIIPYGGSESDHRRLRFVPIPAVFVMMIYMFAMSFVTLGFNNPSSRDANFIGVITDRNTGELVGRIPMSSNDKFFIYRDGEPVYFINNFKYKVVDGIPLSGSFYNPITVRDDKLRCFYAMPINIHYQILPDKESYVSAWKKYKNKSGLESGISAKIDELFMPRLNNFFHEYLSDDYHEVRERGYTPLEYLFHQRYFSELAEKKNSEVSETLYNYLEKKAGSIQMDGVQIWLSK
jgi:hypothetical protein